MSALRTSEINKDNLTARVGGVYRVANFRAERMSRGAPEVCKRSLEGQNGDHGNDEYDKYQTEHRSKYHRVDAVFRDERSCHPCHSGGD
jgi:hypothetical protein